jgi:hypothetical protein
LAGRQDVVHIKQGQSKSSEALLTPSSHYLPTTLRLYLAMTLTARSLPAIPGADRGYPLEGTSSVGGYQPKRARVARFDPPPRKGTAPCQGFTALSPSPSSSPCLLFLPPPLRQHAPTETAPEAFSRLSGAPSCHSSRWTAAVGLIPGASAPTGTRRTSGPRSILRGRKRSFHLPALRGALYGHLFSLDNGPNVALTTTGGLYGTPL